MSLQSLIDTFKGKYTSIPELEVRFYDINYDNFKTIYEALSKDNEPSFECAVFVIDEISKNERDRREIYYTNGVVSLDKCVKKKRLHKNVIIPNDYMKYGVGLSLETPIQSVGTKASNEVRFRTRASFSIEYNSLKWRVDITAVKTGQLKNLEKVLPSIRSKICGLNNSTQSFMDNISKNADMFDKYEVEIEYIDDPAKLTQDDLSVSEIILRILNPKYDQTTSKSETTQKIASLLYDADRVSKIKSFRDLVPQVKTLDKRLYGEIYPMPDYFMTEKTDGVRNLVMLSDNTIYIINSNDITKDSIHTAEKLRATIVDAEFSNNKFLIFDAIQFGDIIASEPFTARQSKIGEISAYLNKVCEDNKKSYSFGAKKYTQIDPAKIKTQVSAQYSAKYDAEIDGLIFVEPNKSYIETATYKWKPYEHNTIDFLAVKMPANMLGVHPYVPEPNKTIYILFVSILHYDREKIGLGLIHDYKKLIPQADSAKYPIQFSPSINPLAYIYQAEDTTLDNKIIELTRNNENTDWKFVRHRDDRIGEKTYYGNAFSTAERIFINFYDRFDIDYLWNPTKGYFKELATKVDPQYYANKCKRIIISLAFKKYLTNSKKVIDLAVGRGADLPRYRAIGVSELLGIERDSAAIGELIMRKFTILERTKRGANEEMTDCEEEYRRIQAIEYDKLIKKDSKSLTIHTLIADLTTPYCLISAKCGQYGFSPNTANGVVCNFAIHYMCDYVKNLKNVLYLANKQITVGGHFIITTLNGEKVFNLLRGKQMWEYVEDGIVKYKIEKKYKSNEMAKVGQVISTLLPMSNEMMDEPLCHIANLVSEAAKHGFECVENRSFADYRDEMMANNITDALNDDDWHYIGLYQMLVFKCVSNKK